MIPRYSRPEMAAIWSPETKFRIWFDIEAHAADAMAELGVIPPEAARTIREKGEAAMTPVEKSRHDWLVSLSRVESLSRIEAASAPAVARTVRKTRATVIDTIFKALAPAIPDRIIAGHHADLVITRTNGKRNQDGSLFVFNGRHRAVLITYPRDAELDAAFAGRMPT